MAENNEKLEDFSWDSWDESSLEEVSKEPKEEIKEVKEEVVSKEEPKKESEKLEKPKEDILGEGEDFDKIQFVEDEEYEDEDSYDNNIISRLKEEGIFSTLDEESLDQEMSDEYLPELIDKEVDARVEETMESFFEELDEDAIAFLKFKKNGGSTSQFISMLQDKSGVPAGDIDTEDYQEKIIKHGMKLEGYDNEDIEDKIEWLKEGGKLKRHAEKYESKLEKATQAHQQQLLKEQEKQVAAAKQQREELSNNLKNLLQESDTIGQFSFSKRDKKELHPYMTKANVKVGKNSYMTKMQKDLQAAFQDPEKILVIAKLLKNNFDISDVIRDTETKVTRKTKDKIERKSTKIKSSKSSTGRRKKALFEYFDD